MRKGRHVVLVRFYSTHLNAVSGRAFRFAKNNFDSIRFTPEKKIDSNRFVRFDSPIHMAVTQEVGGRGAAWLGAVYGVLPHKIWVPH